jgi:hypothetical protein
MASFAQGPSLSPHELKESYFEKRASFEQRSTKAISSANQVELDRIVTILTENAPNSYEYHLVKYVNGNFDASLAIHLLEAYKLKPNSTEVLREMFGYYAMMNDQTKTKEIASVLKNQYTTAEFAYYESLFSTSTGTFYLFSGESDAYPALVLQSLGKIRSNATIINLDFLQNDAYRKRIQSQVGGLNMKFLGNEAAFVSAMINAKSSTFCVSTTVSQNYLGSLVSSMTITGLVYQKDAQDQKARLQKFWNQVQPTFESLILSGSSGNALYGNYLPPLLTLYRLKILNSEKDLILRNGIVALAQKIGEVEAVNGILSDYEQIE